MHPANVTISDIYDDVTFSEVPRNIDPRHLNQLLGVDEHGHRKAMFSVPEFNERRRFALSDLGYVDGFEIEKQTPADIFYAYWFFLRRNIQFLPDKFCARTDREETAVYLFAGLPIACHIDGYCGSVYPCMTFHNPKIGIHPKKEARWVFSHIPVMTLATKQNWKFLRNVRTVVLNPTK